MDPRSYLGHPAWRSQSAVLNDLHALNRQFVTLMLGQPLADPPSADAEFLDPAQLTALATLTEGQLEKLATCPYSLFDLAFADECFWRVRQEAAPATLATLEIHLDRQPGGAAFALAALLYARQLCAAAPDMARLLLGMTDEVASILSRLPLADCAAVAFAARPILGARLARHPRFWPDLMDFVRQGTKERYLAAQTLGVQQSASKL